MKSFWFTTKSEKKEEYFKATNVKSPEHLTAGQWVKKTQMEKSQSVYALVWSPVFSPVFSPSLKVYPSQRSALRMHTCGATMIHIITTCGNDSNQKLKCTRQIIWGDLTAKEKILTKYSYERAGKSVLYCLHFCKESVKKRLCIQLTIGGNAQEHNITKNTIDTISKNQNTQTVQH